MARTLRAVLIDDNPVVCRAIEAAVDWEGLGCRVAGSAYDGNDGLRLIRAQCPELIITDIRMPGRDGLEMVQEIRSLLPHSRILIITGYPDFSYAQRAIGLGVFSLTLKPIDYAALTQEIAKAAKALRREMEQAAEQSSRQHEISYLNKEVHARRRENACAAVEPYLLDPSKKPPLKAIQELGLDRLSFQLCCGRQSISPEETLLCAKRLSTVELLLSDMSYHSGKNCEIFVIPYPAKPGPPSDTYGPHLLYSCLRAADPHFILAYSRISEGWSCLPEVYAALQRDLEKAVFWGGRSYICSDLSGSPRPVPDQEILRLAEGALHGIGPDNVVEMTRRFLLNHFNGCSLELVHRVISCVCLMLWRQYQHPSDIALQDVSLHAAVNKARYIRTQEEMSAYLEEFAASLTAKQEDALPYPPQVRSILEYARQHCCEDITRARLSEEFGLSESYISTLIKKHTGQNLSDLLSDLRIERAKALLRDPKIRIKEIYERLGFSSYAYFYQVFVKKTGMSPTEYQSHLK